MSNNLSRRECIKVLGAAGLTVALPSSSAVGRAARAKAPHIVFVTGDDEYRSEITCLLYTSPSPRDRTRSRMPSSA